MSTELAIAAVKAQALWDAGVHLRKQAAEMHPEFARMLAAGSSASASTQIAEDVARVQTLRRAASELLQIRDDLLGDNDPAAAGRRIGIEDAARHLQAMADRLEWGSSWA